MADKKIIFKRVGITLASTALAAGVGGGIIAASYIGDKLIPLDDSYMPKDKIEYLADELGVDTSVMHGSDSFRLRHKNGEPINFYFEDNYPEECKSISIDAIDYLFDLVHDINPLYNYAVVEDSKSADITLKNKKINLKTARGNGEEIVEVEVAGTSNPITSVITIDLDKLKLEDESYPYNSVYFVTLHETMHQFGYEDLYQDNNQHETASIMSGNYISYLTTNDYDNLLLYYSPNTSKENLPQLVKTLKDKESKYMESLFFDEDYACRPSRKLPFEKLTPDENVVLDNGIYNITINDDNYSLTINDNNKQIISSGKIVKLSNNMMVLKNCHLPTSKKFDYDIGTIFVQKSPNGYYMNVAGRSTISYLNELSLENSMGR